MAGPGEVSKIVRAVKSITGLKIQSTTTAKSASIARLTNCEMTLILHKRLVMFTFVTLRFLINTNAKNLSTGLAGRQE